MTMSEDSEFLKYSETINAYLNFYEDLWAEMFNLEHKNNVWFKQVKSVNFYTFSEKEESYVLKPDIEFDDEAVRLAYLLKFSVLNSYCVSEHFQDVYKCDLDLFNHIIEMKTARICCFGGGSGIELFAICQVISNFLRIKSNEECHFAIKLYFTVIDVCSEWESWIVSLVKKLRNCVKDVIDVRMRFISADLTKKWEEDVLKAVQKADILTMVKFISALNLSEVDYEQKKDLRLLANVAQKMKLNSFIFFLDLSGGGHYKKMEHKMEKYQYFEQVQSFLHQEYKVCKEDLKISKSFSSFISSIMPLIAGTKVSSGTWQKCIPKLKIKRKKPNSVKKIPKAQNAPSPSNILEEQMEGLLLKEVLKVKEEDLDDYYEAPEGQEDPNRVREIEVKNQNKVKEILKKSGIYKTKKLRKNQ